MGNMGRDGIPLPMDKTAFYLVGDAMGAVFRADGAVHTGRSRLRASCQYVVSALLK